MQQYIHHKGIQQYIHQQMKTMKNQPMKTSIHSPNNEYNNLLPTSEIMLIHSQINEHNEWNECTKSAALPNNESTNALTNKWKA